MEDARPIVDADEEGPADEDADLQGEEEELPHEEVGSTAIHMVTVHTPEVCVRHLDQNTQVKQPLRT